MLAVLSQILRAKKKDQVTEQARNEKSSHVPTANFKDVDSESAIFYFLFFSFFILMCVYKSKVCWVGPTYHVFKVILVGGVFLCLGQTFMGHYSHFVSLPWQVAEDRVDFYESCECVCWNSFLNKEKPPLPAWCPQYLVQQKSVDI